MIKAVSFVIAGALITGQLVAADGPVINTPASLIQCQPVLLSWTNAVGKTYVSILPDKQISATPLVAFEPQDASTSGIKWIPNLDEGTAVTLSISDDTGVKNYSNTITVLKGQDQSCLKKGDSAAAAGSSSTSSGSAAAAAPAPAVAAQPNAAPATAGSLSTTNSTGASSPPLTGSSSSSSTSTDSTVAMKPDSPATANTSGSMSSQGKMNATSATATGADIQAPGLVLPLAVTALTIVAIGCGMIL